MASAPHISRLRPGWARPEHPVYRLEQRRRVASGALRALQHGCLPSLLAAAGLAAVAAIVLAAPQQIMWSLESSMSGTLSTVLVLMVLIQLVGGAASNILMVAQASPLISGEVELQSWGLLRSTTLTVREIVLAKYAATLAHLGSALIGLTALRLASATTALLWLAYTLLRGTFYFDRAGWLRMIERRLWVGPVIAGVICLAWYVTQPAVQHLLNGALGMLASSFAPSRARAVAAALAARLAGWAGSIVVNGGLIFGLGFLILANWAEPQYAPIRAFRTLPPPSDLEVSLVVSGTVAVYVLTVFAAQVGLTLLALRLAQRRARRLGG